MEKSQEGLTGTAWYSLEQPGAAWNSLEQPGAPPTPTPRDQPSTPGASSC